MSKRTTLFDIADLLGISIGTVHRALHDHPDVSQATKRKVLQKARLLGYRPNLAARYLSQKRSLKVSVNTLKGTTSFWDDVRRGIQEEARSLGMEKADIEFRTYPQLGEGDEEAFHAALESKVNGIIMFPTRPDKLRSWISRAARLKIPVICVAADAPGSERSAVVSIDTKASGSLAADLMGRLRGGIGRVAVTVSDLKITEHAEKFEAFSDTLRAFYPSMEVDPPIEDHDVETKAYNHCRELMAVHPDLAGIYVTTEASIPVLAAARDAGLLGKLTIITTDLFPALVPEITSGVVTATIQQRPRTQGRMAFRALHRYLFEGECPAQITLAPHLITRGNLNFFLQRDAFESGGGGAHFGPVSETFRAD